MLAIYAMFKVISGLVNATYLRQDRKAECFRNKKCGRVHGTRRVTVNQS